ncbi:MAG: hypothetical protein KDD34_02250 [Bdellovibrionales bacterium]|nr:hypothetical protein [Bdellovibrionales bacterium]
MRIKIFVSFLILLASLYHLYISITNGSLYQKPVSRDKQGFVIDASPVKIVATKKQVEVYQKLMENPEIKNAVNELVQSGFESENGASVSISGGTKMPLEALSLDSQVAAQENQDEAEPGGALKDQVNPLEVNEQGPSLTSIQEENHEGASSAALAEQLPESSGNIEPPQEEMLEDLMNDVKETQQKEKEQAKAGVEVLEKDRVGEEVPAPNDIANEPQTDNGQKNKELAETEPQKEVSVLNQVPPVLKKQLMTLISCKTKDAKGRIPDIIWKKMVEKARQETYLTDGKKTLPEISEEIFKEKECWPKLWSLNPQIENPYVIPADQVLNMIPQETRSPASEE